MEGWYTHCVNKQAGCCRLFCLCSWIRYLCGGFESNGTKKVAKLWKNGVAASLTNGSTILEASSVVVNNGNIYVAGYESNGTKKVAKLWKKWHSNKI